MLSVSIEIIYPRIYMPAFENRVQLSNNINQRVRVSFPESIINEIISQ
jgi:hypothetical protein